MTRTRIIFLTCLFTICTLRMYSVASVMAFGDSGQPSVSVDGDVPDAAATSDIVHDAGNTVVAVVDAAQNHNWPVFVALMFSSISALVVFLARKWTPAEHFFHTPTGLVVFSVCSSGLLMFSDALIQSGFNPTVLMTAGSMVVTGIIGGAKALPAV